MKEVKGCPETYDLEKLRAKIHELRKGGEIRWPIYSRAIHDVVEDAVLVNRQIIVLEGNWLLSSEDPWNQLVTLCDDSVFIGADESFLKDRLVDRKMKGGLSLEEATTDMHYRVRKRIVGNIAGVICFTVLYFLLPSSIYAYIGIIGGIGVGFSAQYGWQAVFNTFGALAIATESYGLKGAVSLRVIQNVFGVVFALAFCVIFYWFMSKKKESDVTVHAE